MSRKRGRNNVGPNGPQRARKVSGNLIRSSGTWAGRRIATGSPTRNLPRAVSRPMSDKRASSRRVPFRSHFTIRNWFFVRERCWLVPSCRCKWRPEENRGGTIEGRPRGAPSPVGLGLSVSSPKTLDDEDLGAGGGSRSGADDFPAHRRDQMPSRAQRQLTETTVSLHPAI